jgi:ADP-ribose pyrophosphatase YjhB (NUDIX family)
LNGGSAGPARPHTWEPVARPDVELLAALLATASALEGNVSELLSDRLGAVEFGELVAWAWVVDHDRSHVLLIDHHRRGAWTPPGGRAGPGEHPQVASARELFEETGVRGLLVHEHPALMDAVAMAAPDGTAVTTVGVAYLYVADRGDVLTPEPDQPAAWWPLADPPSRRAEHHWLRLTRHLAGIG